MAGVMLLFAFSMSLVIRIVEKKIDPAEDVDLTGSEIAEGAERKA